MKTLSVDNLQISIYQKKSEMAIAAAEYVASILAKTIKKNGSANMILATGASQFEFVENLKLMPLDWKAITVFHLDEYKDMAITHPASFRKYLKERILDKVQPAKVYYLEGDAPDIEAETRRYEELLRRHDIHVACIGIGENGHIAFNDPPVADFADPRLVKVVELDEACRKQQFGEGWFPTLADVPTHALSLTIPAIMRCQAISCVVPDRRKADAVFNALNGPISTACPASILRHHPNTTLFLEPDSASRLTY
jgi:glucosamine-6-phosphate deaminase